MSRYFRLCVLICLWVALFAATGVHAEDMPIVRDEPLEVDPNEVPVVRDVPLEAAPTLAPMDENARVKRAQQLLNELRYMVGGADGILGRNTMLALKMFQRDYGLVADGTLNDLTLQTLEEKASKRADAVAFQQRLIDLGYLNGKADGIVGDHTVKALKLFQSLNGIDPSGEINDETRAALFSESAQKLPELLVKGDSGDRVNEMQLRLKRFGFFLGEADGDYGKATVTAVRTFQEHLKLQKAYCDLDIPCSGKATPVTLMVLMDPAYSSYAADLIPGAKGDDVQRVERRLKDLGYLDQVEDALFDDYAAAAAGAFKKAAGIDSDGFGQVFVDALFTDDAPVADHYVLHAIARGDRGFAVRDVEEAMVLAGMTYKMPDNRYDDKVTSAVERLYEYLKAQDSDEALMFSDPEKLGINAQRWITDVLPELSVRPDSTSGTPEDIKRVQRRLHMLYYLSHFGIDGTMGNRTVEALKRFQEHNGLAVTGEVDAATRRVLFTNDAVCDKRPYRVEVDLDKQRVYVFELQESGEYQQVQEFICSTGLNDATPRGIFLDAFPANIWHHFSEYDCWAQYSFEVEGNIMIHSVLYDEDDERTLRTGSLYALGQRASHGCIRLDVKSAKWLFTHCKKGSLVIVIY